MTGSELKSYAAIVSLHLEHSGSPSFESLHGTVDLASKACYNWCGSCICTSSQFADLRGGGGGGGGQLLICIGKRPTKSCARGVGGGGGGGGPDRLEPPPHLPVCC